jgi:RHS repeat-associated protein
MSLMVGTNPVYTFDAATNRIANLPCGATVAAYDAAGNQLCSTDQYGAISQYSYDAESRITQIATLNNSSSPFVKYVYGADGARTCKTNSDGTFTEYVYFGGQPIAEKDQLGNWTDYIVANGRKIAKVDAATPSIHVHGDDCANCQSGWVNSQFTSPIVGYQIQTGDTLMLMQKQVNIQGGFQLNTYQGGSTWPYVTDQNGDILNQSTAASGVWEPREVNLNQFAGQTVSNVTATITVSPPLDDVWDIYYRDIAIVSADGTVHPIYTGTMQPSFWQFGVEGETNLSASVDLIPNAATDTAGTHFYVGDHLGTAQLELSGGGWPVYAGQFAPYGQELQNGALLPTDAADGSINHYKFTGKERDAESGNDYFGARYYASGTGRWMSPDWADKPEAVPYSELGDPQSLNLYGYARNNPLSHLDVDGHDVGDHGAVWDQFDANVAAAHGVDNGTLNFVFGQNSPQNQAKAQQQGSTDNPTPDRGGRVKARPDGQPPIPLPPGKDGQANEWEKVPGSPEGPYGPRWQPKFPTDGPQPSAWWDAKDGVWSGEKGDGSPRDHYDRWGNKINYQVEPKHVVLGITLGAGAYVTYRIIRLLPSLTPFTWETIPLNLALP